MKIVVLAFASLLALLDVGTGAPIKCPEKIEPCKCNNNMAYGLHILCADFNDPHDLEKVLTKLRTHKVENLVLHNLVLKEVLPEGLFQGLEICEIAVEKSNLIFPQPAFKGLDDSLERLNIAQNSLIKSSEKFAIARLTNLTELYMKNNPLDVVKNNWLNGKIPSVQKIRLDENEITLIESRAFADLPYLQTISIAGNRIKDVKRSMFPKPAINLTSIDLSGNEITSLPEDFFSDMPALTEVILSGNDLTTLDETTWSKVWSHLDNIVLLDNSLVCDSSLNWIRKAKRSRDQQLSATCVAPGPFVGKDLKDVYDLP